MDENSNADATAMFNLLESFAKHLGCAFICIHHATKGWGFESLRVQSLEPRQ